MGGEAPEGWPTVALGELVEVHHGFAFKGDFFAENQCADVLVTPANFRLGGGFNQEKSKYYDGPVDPRYVLRPGTLLVTMTDLSRSADTLGLPAVVPETRGVRYLHNQRIGRVEIRSAALLDARYLYAALKTETYRQRVVSAATGTTVRHTSPKRIREVSIPLPPLREQCAIASVLGALDDKIESNRQLSEDMAAVVLATVAHAAEASEATTMLGEIAEQVRLSGEPSLPYVGLDAMARGSTVLLDWLEADAPTGASWAFAPGDVLFGKLRPYFKKVAVAPIAGRATREIVILRPRRPRFYGLLVGTVASQPFIDFCTAVSTGTKMPRSEWKDASKYTVGFPDSNVLNELAQLTCASYLKVAALVREARTLVAVRDALLPKLVSGQIRVPLTRDEQEAGETVAAELEKGSAPGY